MNDSKFLSDDPRLTAYALGELAREDRAAVEAAVANDAALRVMVEEIRATAAQLEAALASEPMPDNAAMADRVEQRAAIIAGADLRNLDGGPLRSDRPSRLSKSKLLRFPSFYFVAGGLAAAGVALMVVLQDRGDSAATTQPPSLRREVAVAQVPAVSAEISPVMDEAVRLAPVLPENKSSAQPAEPTMAQSAREPVLIARAPAPVNASLPAPSSPAPRDVAISLPPFGSDPGSRPEPEREKVEALDTSLLAVAAQNMEAWKRDVLPWKRGAAGLRPAPSVAFGAAVRNSARLAATTAPTGGAPGTADGRVEWARMSGHSLAAPAEEPVVLSAYVVGKPAAEGYAAQSSLAGSRVQTGLKDKQAPLASFGANWSKGVVRSSAGAPVAASFGAPFLTAPVNDGRTESYAYREENDFLPVDSNPLSTFSADVDTASYTNVRRMLQLGQLPPPDAVRVEELINYFSYDYPTPGMNRDESVAASSGAVAAGTKVAAAKGESTGRRDDGVAPFAASMEVAEAPWAPTHRLVRIGLKAREVPVAARGAANLVFLLDVSGSMNQPNKLPLVKESLRLLLGRLRSDDRVAIVTYAGRSGLALPSTRVSQAREIAEAIEELRAGGSTNGAMGLHLAYDVAKANFVADGVNRVILCTDGDFNVGVTSDGELVRLVTEKAKSGVFLTVLGFGMGNYKDATLQQIADRGNGNYGYVDSRREAEKLLVEQVSGTLVTIAKDVKLQVEFNPAQVASYRLIGYEKRLLKKEDFNNDAVDAGEIGAGHTVTALYEIVPVGAEQEVRSPAAIVDPLKYQPATIARDRRGATSGELLTLKVRYQEPAGTVSRKLEFPLIDRGARFVESSADFKFASAVAAFGMILRDSPHKGSATLAQAMGWAEAGIGNDPGGYRAECVTLIKQAQTLVQP